jgi:DNA-directed RNA polymerase subunit M/transcription elongation factor TFIIS
MELIVGLVLPCKECKRRNCVYVYTEDSTYMSVCSECGAIYNIDREGYVMQKIIKKERVVIDEITVSVCDRPGCKNEFDPTEGRRFLAMIGGNVEGALEGKEGTTVLATWELCPTCTEVMEKYLVRRIGKLHNRWESLYKDDTSVDQVVTSTVEVTEAEEEAGGSF